MKPRGLTATAIAMGVMNLTGLVNLQWKHHSVAAATIVIILAGYVVLWYYWLGKNWARILVIITSAVAVLDLVFLRFPYRTALPHDSIIVINSVLGVFLLYWLNLKHVRNWFRPSKSIPPGDLPQ